MQAFHATAYDLSDQLAVETVMDLDETNNNLTCTSNLALSNTANLTVGGNATVTGTLGVTGASTFTGQATFNGGAVGAGITAVPYATRTIPVTAVAGAADANYAFTNALPTGLYLISFRLLSNAANFYCVFWLHVEAGGVYNDVSQAFREGMTMPTINANTNFRFTVGNAANDSLVMNAWKL